jgi:tRNA (Thr-GGU) A37 N-methylase
VSRGLDAIDGTPVLDIKPVMREFLPREPVTQRCGHPI